MADQPRLNRQTFQEWAAHPLTQAYRAYLQAESLMLADQWRRGQSMDLMSQAKAMLLQEQATLNWSDLEANYRQLDKHAAEVAESDAEPTEDT
jgi:hypothetical protein